MFADYVVRIDVNSPSGVVTRNNLFQYAWVVEKDDGGALNTPTLVKGSDFNKYFDDEKMIAFGTSLGTKEIYLVNKTNLSTASDTCFWLVDSLRVLTPTELVNFKGFKVFTAGTMGEEAKTLANTKYTSCIVDGNVTSSPYELLEAFLDRTASNLNDMQYMSLSTWEPVLNTESQYLEAFNSNLIFANTPDLSTPAVELGNLKMGGVSWRRVLVGEYVKQQLQTQIKQYIKTDTPDMTNEDYVVVETQGNRLLETYMLQGLIGTEARFEVDFNQSKANIIAGTLINVRVNLDGINSMWRVEAILTS